MNEVDKLYENADIKQNRMCEWTCKGSETCSLNCKHYSSMQLYYPPFTAEKQIELIKFLYIKYKKYEMFKVSNRDEVGIRTSENTFYAYGIDIQNAIANFFNRNWQCLTEEERKQIKEILE